MVIVAAVAVTLLTRWQSQVEPLLREQAVAYLSERFGSDVEIASLRVAGLPRMQVEGRGVRVWWQHRRDVPPVLELDRFRFAANWDDLLLRPRTRISELRLEGLRLVVARRQPDAAASPATAARREPAHPAARQTEIGRIVADGASLTILPRDAAKQPQVYALRRLTLWGAGLGRPMSYRAELTNHKPPGQIDSEGVFGPWRADEPGLTPLAATYTFSKADLSVFRGIAGMLESAGRFHGVLSRIAVEGETRTPDFRLSIANNPIPLTTKFHAIVDGTTGDTLLQPVRAVLGRTAMTVTGAIAGDRNVRGKTIDLTAVIEGGRLEDVVHLAVKGPSPMTGRVRLQSLIRIPRGDVDVVDKLGLDGTFRIAAVRFTNPEIQGKIDELSRRGQGRPGDEEVADVASEVTGGFQLSDARLALRSLSYETAGAALTLDGAYGLRSQELDFAGALRLDAKASQTFRGMKRVMLKPFDWMVSRPGGGTVLSLRISGTREQPKFGVDLKRTLAKKD